MNSDGHRFLKPGGARRPASRASISRACLLLAGFWLLTSAAPAAIFTNNARIEIPDSTGSLSRSAANGDLTVMCWFKFSIPSGVTINNDMTILVNQSGSTTTNNTHAYNLYFNAETGAVEFTAKGAAGLYRQTLISRPFIDRWYHVAVAMSGGSYYAYVDGQTVTTPGTGASGDSSVTNGITIGGWGSGKYLWGEVQEVAIYKYYLQATDVRAYMFGDQRSNPEIQGYYKLGASTNSADWLKNFVAGAAAGSGNAFPSIDNLAFEETDQAGEQSLYDSRKNGGSDAITPLSGAFSWSQTAFARPTPGIAFQFAYGYSSALPPDGGSGDAYDKRSIGRGWRHTFDVRLVRGEKTTVLNLITWDGATEVWDRSPTNASIYFTRHKEYRGELIRLNNLDDDYEWTTSDRLVYRFRSPEYGNENLNGRLLEIRDFNTNRVTISGNSLGLVTNVTDSAAGNYTFIYSSQLLTNVTFGNWSLNFNYDFANRRLISKSITNTSGLYTAVSTTWQFQYANPSNGPLVRIIDPRGFTNTFVQYDQYGRKTNEVDALNRATATRYGVPGKRQITRVDPGTNSWIETYDRKGRITAQQDPLTNITSYTNDDRGNRTSITEPLGWKTCFGYDSRANVIARTNELGEITRWAFHGFFNKATNEVDALGWTNHYVLDNNTGNLLRHFDDRGTLVSYTYRTNGLVETTTDANGNTSRFAYDTNGFLVAQTDPATNTNSFAVNEVGWKLAHTNALGKVTTFAYDLNGNVLRTVDPIQRVFTKTYDANGNLLAASDAKNQFTFSFYDAANQRTQTVDRAGATNRFFYTTRGKLDRATDALGNTTTNSYDSANRLIAASDPLGQSVTNVFDANGNVVTMIDKLGQSWSKTYDRLNRVLTESDPLGDTKRTTYDPVGRIKTITTPNGFVSTHDYDGRGRLAKWVDAEGYQWCYDYDGVGNITNITDALTNHYVMTYGNRNERTLERNQDNFEWTYAYDKLLRPERQVDPNGLVRTIRYDDGGRVLEAGFSTGRVNAFNYDENNNPAMVTRSDPGKPATVTILDYDAMDRATQCRDTFNKIVNYTYDALGRVATLRYPDGKTLTNRYDAISRLTNQVDWAGRELKYAYDKASRLVSRTYPNGITQTNTFDTANRITSLSYSNFSLQPSAFSLALTYAYDRNGNKVGSTEKGTLDWPVPARRDETSGFTASGRITNRVDALSPTNNFTYQFDPSGNMTNAFGGGQSWRLTYDEDNRTTSIRWDCGLTARNITNRYDALGRRIAKTVDGDQTRFVLDLAGNMERTLCDMNGAGVITAWYVHGPDLCYKVDATNGLTCYHADAQANIIALTDGNTNVVAQYAYTPYGRILGLTNFQSNISNPYLFVGSQGVMNEFPDLAGTLLDPGLYFMRARYYSAEAGVFLSTDPVKHIGPGWKPIAFSFAGNNPLTFSDPKGEDFGCTLVIIGVAAFIANYAADAHLAEANHQTVDEGDSFTGSMFAGLGATSNPFSFPLAFLKEYEAQSLMSGDNEAAAAFHKARNVGSVLSLGWSAKSLANSLVKGDGVNAMKDFGATVYKTTKLGGDLTGSQQQGGNTIDNNRNESFVEANKKAENTNKQNDQNKIKVEEKLKIDTKNQYPNNSTIITKAPEPKPEEKKTTTSGSFVSKAWSWVKTVFTGKKKK